MFCSSVGRGTASGVPGSTRIVDGSEVDLRERDLTLRAWSSGEEGADVPLSMSISLSEDERGESAPATV